MLPMLYPDYLALQAATMHAMLERDPELHARVEGLQKEYKDLFFHDGAGAVQAQRAAFDYLLENTRPGNNV